MLLSQKYRPTTFNEVVGQTSTVKDLSKRSKTGAFPGYMLFVGPSGTGKTTLAFIIAKVVNCMNPVDTGTHIEPCNECDNCLDITKQTFSRDTSFINCSDGKEAVMDKLSALRLKPRYGKYRVMILDEFQELSVHSKGALLAEFEKKRPHAIVIACTMENSFLYSGKTQKSALASRFEKYRFNSLPPIEIANYIKNLTDELIAEGSLSELPISFYQKGGIIQKIVECSGGSLRNALQWLDRVINSELYTPEEFDTAIACEFDATSYDILTKLLRREVGVLVDILGYPDAKELFFKMRAALVEASIYYHTQHLSAEWKGKYVVPLSKYNITLTSLMKVFDSVDVGYAFSVYSLLIKLTLYLDVAPPVRKR